MPFPTYIADFPPFEEDLELNPNPVKKTKQKITQKEFIERQKEDFSKALSFAALHIADNQSFKDTSPEDIEKIVKSIHGLASKTVAERTECLAGELRTNEEYIHNDAGPEFNCRTYNLTEPWDIFSILMFSDYEQNFTSSDQIAEQKIGIKTATHFLKFYLKGVFPDRKIIQLLEERVELTLKTNGYNLEIWRNEYFSGKSLSQWFSSFLKNEGKDLPQAKDSASDNEKALAFSKRLWAPETFTAEEKKAGNKVISYFPLASELPGRMKLFTNKLSEMLKAKEDPVKIACYAHQALTIHNHFFFDCNGRTARIFMNSILIHYGLPAIQLENMGKDKEAKRRYYEAVEAGVDSPDAFENFIREKLTEQQNRQKTIPTPLTLCVAARDGDLILTAMLVEAGVDLNTSPQNAKNWTPLHYACAKGQTAVVIYLVEHGADITLKTEGNNDQPGKTALDLIKAPELLVQIPLIKARYEAFKKPAKIALR